MTTELARRLPGSARRCAIFYPHIIEYGGIERNVVALAESILSHGCQPVLQCFYDRVGMSKYVPGLIIEDLGEGSSRLGRLATLRKHYSRGSADLVARGLPFFFGARAGHYAALAGLSGYVLHYTDPPSLLSEAVVNGALQRLLYQARAWAVHRILRRSVHRAERCLTMTRANADELAALYGRKFTVVYQGGLAAPVGAVSRRRSTGTEIRIFSLCRLNESKHLDWIVRALADWRVSADPRLQALSPRVILAGTGPALDSLKCLADKLGVAEFVEFPGFLTQEAVETHYAHADVVAVPGRQGYGLPVLEALYRAIPVVLSRESRVSEILEAHPLAAITEHSASAFSAALRAHVLNMRDKTLDGQTLPNLPTEADWGHAIGVQCAWW